MSILWLVAASWATPVDRGLQAQVHPAGMAFLSEQVSDLSFDFGPTSFSGSWECYDTLDVNGFNLRTEIDRVDLVPKNNTLAIDVTLGTVRGEDMELVGVSGWFDICIDFDADLLYIELDDGALSGELSARVVDGSLDLDFLTPPVVMGDFDSDINWFPDDLVWSFMEESVRELAADLLAEQLPPIIEELTADSLLLATFGDTPVIVDVSDVAVSNEGLYASADVDLLGSRGGDGARLDLEPHGDSHLAIGVTEAMVEGVLEATWVNGLLAPDSEMTTDLLADLIAGLDLGTDASAELGLSGPPKVTIDASGVHLELPGAILSAVSDGEQLLELVADVDGLLEIELQHGGITLTAHELNLEVLSLDLSRLVDGDPNNVQAFLEGWVVQAATAAMADIEVYGSHFEALGFVLRLDEAESQDGGLVAWCTVFDEDDPDVDREAPDTELAITDGSPAVATFFGLDDRAGDLTYSWRVDDGSWSSWSPENRVEVEVEPGNHRFDVIARDLWHNQDRSPAVAAFVVEAEGGEQNGQKKGCGCTSSPTTGLVAGVLLVLVVARRRFIPMAGMR